MEEMLCDLNEFINNRTNTPLNELEKKDFMKKKREEIFELLDKINEVIKDDEKTVQNMEKYMAVVDEIAEQKENAFYLTGFTDAIKYMKFFEQS